MKTLQQMEQYRIHCLSMAVAEWVQLQEIDEQLPESLSYLNKFIKSKYSATVRAKCIQMSTWQAAKGKAADIVVHFQRDLCPMESRLKSQLEWEPCTFCVSSLCVSVYILTSVAVFFSDEERCIAFIAGSRAYEELHHTVQIQNLTPAMMEKMLFPKAHEVAVEDAEITPFNTTSDLTLSSALGLLGLLEMPTTRGQLYMATYAKMKESETSEDENFPTKAELQQAREVVKHALDIGAE